MCKVSVVIATHNRARYLDLTLASYVHQTLKSYELIIVDDGSTDSTEEIVRQYQSILPIVYTKIEHKGRCHARNHGIQLARADILVFTDDDRIAVPTFLEEHCLCAQRNPKTLGIGEKREVYTIYASSVEGPQSKILSVLRNPDLYIPRDLEEGTPLLSRDDVMERFDRSIRSVYLQLSGDSYPGVLQRYGEDLDGFHFGWICATTANMSYNRAGTEPVWFDIRFADAGVEDTEFSYQLYKSGYGFRFLPRAINYHQLHPRSPVEGALYKRNARYFSLKYDDLMCTLFALAFASKWRITLSDINDLYIALKGGANPAMDHTLKTLHAMQYQTMN